MARTGVAELTGRRIESRAACGDELPGTVEVVVKEVIELGQNLGWAG